MVRLLCHGINQKADLFQIVPTRESVSEEFVMYLEKCIKCSAQILEIHRIDIWGNRLMPVRLKSSKIHNFLKSMNVIWQPKRISTTVPINSGFYLYYNEYGKKKKCFQSLAGLQLGKSETDLYTDLKYF